MFKRIYLEISDYCNLNCSFCTSPRKNQHMLDFSQFINIVEQIKGYATDLYLHVLGEPLIHQDISKMIEYASKYFNVCITTNGMLISNKKAELLNAKIKKMNFSLNSTFDLKTTDVDNYLKNILLFIEQKQALDDVVSFNLRLWAFDNFNSKLEYIENYLATHFKQEIQRGINKRLAKKVILTYDKEFMWPSLTNAIHEVKGSCLGGKTHVAILANGEVGICCLDSLADSKLGNVFVSNFSDIVGQAKFKEVIQGFNNNKLVLKICQHCNFYKR